MDENISSGSRADATGNGWTATDPNANVGNTTGILSLCANISTIAKGLSISTNIDTRAQTTPFSISLWFRQSDVRAGNGVMAKILAGGTGWLIYPATQSPTAKLHWYTTTDANVVSDSDSGVNIDASAFNHLVAGYDGTNKHFYMNGVSLINTAVAGVNRGTNPIVIGNYSDLGATTGVAGFYDEVGYWNRMLSAADVTMLYNGGAAFSFYNFTL